MFGRAVTDDAIGQHVRSLKTCSGTLLLHRGALSTKRGPKVPAWPQMFGDRVQHCWVQGRCVILLSPQGDGLPDAALYRLSSQAPGVRTTLGYELPPDRLRPGGDQRGDPRQHDRTAKRTS